MILKPEVLYNSNLPKYTDLYFQYTISVVKCQYFAKYAICKKRLENRSFQGVFLGGDKRDRTADLLNAIQALSQLSYTPKRRLV